jgi:tRNA pseudouridine65 synthase
MSMQTQEEQIHKIEVIYRDDRLIAVSKPAGMIVHRGWGDDSVTVADVVRDQFVGKQVFGLHRLDRNTSGVLLFALDSEAARIYQGMFGSGELKKCYVALVRGPMLEGCIVEHALSQREHGHRVDAVTQFIPLAHKDRWTLVQAWPKTGRLHQIRRHLKHLSHPIVGDVKYGKGEVNRYFREQYQLFRMALHAISIRLTNIDGTELVLHSPVPSDLAEPLEKLGIAVNEVVR